MMRAAGKGDLYIHQGERSERERAATGEAGRDARDRPATCPEDASGKRAAGGANWNVIATTGLGGNLMEHYVYEPYGSLTVNQSSSWGDRDADGDVDSTDKGTVGVTCTGTPSGECRILDLDFDGDYDNDDATAFDNNLVQGAAKKAGRTHSGVGQAMGHQGLPMDSATMSHQNRYRNYEPDAHRYLQPDPLLLGMLHPPVDMAHPDGQNVYLYLRGNPPTKTDPKGMQACTASHGSYCGNCNTHIFDNPLPCASSCMDYWCCHHDSCWENSGVSDFWKAVHLNPTGIGYNPILGACDRNFCRGVYCCGANSGDPSYRGLLYLAFSCWTRYSIPSASDCNIRYRTK